MEKFLFKIWPSNLCFIGPLAVNRATVCHRDSAQVVAIQGQPAGLQAIVNVPADRAPLIELSVRLLRP